MRLYDIIADSEDVYIFELSSEDRKLMARTQWQICDEMDLHPVSQNHWAQMLETHPGRRMKTSFYSYVETRQKIPRALKGAGKNYLIICKASNFL